MENKEGNNPKSENKMSDFFHTGMIMPYAGDVPPTGWLLCDGSPVRIAKYVKLYCLIKDKTSQCHTSGCFFLPNLKNTFLRGASDDFFDFSKKGADEVELSIDNMPSHTHNVIIEDEGHLHEGVCNYWKNPNSGNLTHNHSRGGDLFNSHTAKSYSNLKITNEYEGGSKPVKILPSYVEINYIIKY